MKIVIWKAPRCLRGLLRRMFGITHGIGAEIYGSHRL